MDDLNWVHCSSCGKSFCTSSVERAASIALGFCHVHHEYARPAGFLTPDGSYVLVEPIDHDVFTTLREAQRYKVRGKDALSISCSIRSISTILGTFKVDGWTKQGGIDIQAWWDGYNKWEIKDE